MTDRLDRLLSKLEHVTKSGDGYRAKCPVHGGKSKTSLSVTEKDEGRILLWCFVCECPANDILAACGLEFADIMPERLNHKSSPQQLRKWKQDALHRDWAEALKDALYEIRVVLVSNLQKRNDEPLNDEEMERFNLAIKRIESVERHFNGKS